jgi:hypothetical protein
MFLDQYSSCYFVITAVLQQHVLNPCIIITTEKCIKHLDAVIFNLEKTTDLQQVTDKLYHNCRGDRH